MALEARSLDPFAGIVLIKASPGRSLEQAFGSFALLQDTHGAVVLVPWRTKSSDWPWTHLSQAGDHLYLSWPSKGHGILRASLCDCRGVACNP
jgi:hypothetical protein